MKNNGQHHLRAAFAVACLLLAAACGDSTPSSPDGGAATRPPDINPCALGSTLCSGKCINANADHNHCGKCGNQCESGQVCSAGSCMLSCQKNLFECSGSCVNLNTDVGNCGKCDKKCASGEVCSAGKCTVSCQKWLTDCAGSCSGQVIDAQVSTGFPLRHQVGAQRPVSGEEQARSEADDAAANVDGDEAGG